MPSFGEEVKESVPSFRHVKEPRNSVNYDVLTKFLVYFPSLAQVSLAYVLRGVSGDE